MAEEEAEFVLFVPLEDEAEADAETALEVAEAANVL
jgi:hypothetical protein